MIDQPDPSATQIPRAESSPAEAAARSLLASSASTTAASPIAWNPWTLILAIAGFAGIVIGIVMLSTMEDAVSEDGSVVDAAARTLAAWTLLIFGAVSTLLWVAVRGTIHGVSALLRRGDRLTTAR